MVVQVTVWPFGPVQNVELPIVVQIHPCCAAVMLKTLAANAITTITVFILTPFVDA